MPSIKRKITNPDNGGLWGIVGGTFNPIHFGHLIMAEAVRQSSHADGMLFIPAAKHPLKSDEDISESYSDRVAMIKAAIAGNSNFHLYEPKHQSGYTIDLIEYLRSSHPKARFFLAIGSDIIDEFTAWHKFREIENSILIVIAARPGFKMKSGLDFLKSAEKIMIPQYDISSSNIRARVRAGLSIKYMVPEAVEKYILKKGLYGG